MLVPISRTNPWSHAHAHHAQGPAADAGAHRDSGGGAAFAPPSFLALLYLLAGLLAVYLLHAGARRLYACCVPSASRPARAPQPAPALPCRRVDPAEVAVSLPVRAHDGDGDDDVCAVCLTELQLQESVKAIPACGHVFHPPCIDRWLQSLAASGAGHASCPLCRRSATDPVDDDGPLKPPQQQQQHDEEAPAPAA
ncbi:hypothetical protein ACQJBY_056637 [Aegilops geniculata]